MQILPNQKSSSQSLGDALFAKMGHSTSGTDSFEDYLMATQEAQQAVDAGTERSVSSALENNQPAPAPLQEAPYSVKSKTDAGTYTLDEVTFTKPELVELRQDLIAAGAPPETLEKFDKLVNQPDGATLAQVIASLQPTKKAPLLSDDEKNILKGFLQKIDSTGALGDKFFGLMESGDRVGAMKLLSQTLTNMDPSARFSIDTSEIAVLGKALGLSDTGSKQLLAGFGPASSLELNSKQMLQLLSPAQGELTQQVADNQKLNAAFDSVIGPILKKARDRMQAEKDAASLQSRQVEQSKIMINKTVTTTARDTVENAAANAGQHDDKATLKGADASLKGATNNKEAAEQNTASQQAQVRPETAAEQLKNKIQGEQGKVNTDASPKAEKVADQQLQGQQQAKANADLLPDQRSDNRHDMSQGGNNSAGNKNSANAGWDALLNKVEVRPSATNANNATGNMQGVHTGLLTAGATPTANASTPPHLSRQVASQVEQAMLSAMRDGTKKLELQLNPGDLGSLTLTLTTRNGEVSATIRSEKGETAELMSRQLDVLRTNLEQQGIKVDKLEVQTQAHNQQNESWQSMQQHNNQQEEHARREQLDRLRNLGKVRNSSTNTSVTTLEQGLQLTPHTAESAAQSIHIVA